MNGESLDYVDESFDDESFDDESFDDETAEFLPGIIGGLLPGVASGIAGLFNPQPSRPPLSRVQVPASGSGVRNATLSTPAGQATIALPEAAARQDEFRAVTASLKAGIDRNTERLNTVAGDVKRLSDNFVRIETDTRAQVTKLRTDARKALVRSRREQAVAIAKMRKEQSSQQMTNLMLTMMMQRQVQDQLNAHTHPNININNHTHGALATVANPTDGAAGAASLPVGSATTTGSSDNSMMMLLPLMMMQDGGSGSDNMMLPMMMMFAFK